MDQAISDKLSIKLWAESDRPREKLLEKGSHVLTDAELLAIIIGSGSRSETAVELCQKILKEKNNDLYELSRMTVSELTRFKGIGAAKAISIVAALELGRRRRETIAPKKEKITCSKDVVDILQPVLGDLVKEEFWIILLNRANIVIGKKRISEGGVAGTVADSKIIFKEAVDKLASSIILSHNHPSGNVKPSDADLKLTKRLKEAGQIFEIPVLDHIIITQNSFYSFADEGLM
ncbi:MAG: RadC family protein [Bacteroidia bacterium]